MKIFKKAICGILAAVLLIIFVIFGYNTIMKALYPKDYADFVTKYSEEFDVPTTLCFSVIKCESNFDSNAKSSANAVGLMQLTEETFLDMAKILGEDKAFNEYATDPEINIKYGIRYLKYLIEYFDGDQKTVIAAYNAGLGNVNKWIADDGKLEQEDIVFSETKEYVKRIEKTIKIYNSLYKDGN
jgi:soluble lytic murein transglycosylase